ncbi:MAG TPA: riboflavin synthase, partial [Pseudonocardiaceae bacterium]|nr:riboflavin synthase [Pseudonocardiaceae bacterium]
MFTGIVEERGEVVAVEQVPNAARLTVAGAVVTADAKHGDSIAVSGVCLTVVDVAGGRFTVDVV